MKPIYALWIFFALTGCGYRLAKPCELVKIHIPFIEGDRKGEFTEQLVFEMSAKSFTLCETKEEFIFKGHLDFFDDEKIGFRHDKTKQGVLKKDLVAVEGRKKIMATVHLEDREKNIVWGPYNFTEESDYDYVDQDAMDDLTVSVGSKRVPLLEFSLGQLESIEAAQDIKENVVFKKLAKRISEALSHDLPTLKKSCP